jgi:cytochrome c-type biogenesis protein CcmE
MRRHGWFVTAALGLAAVLAGFLIANIGDDLVYYQTPTEVRSDPARVDGGRFRLGGQVVPGTVAEDDDGVLFEVTDGQSTVPVDHRGAPQQLFREGIGVVVEGIWDGTTFHSDSMIIKHDEQYRTDDGGIYTPDSRYP